MKRYDEPTTVGLTNDAHEKLSEIHESGEFDQKMDVYRFAIALALFRGADPGLSRQGSWTTVFNVGSLDQDGGVFTAVATLRSADLDEPVWRTAERLAAWGIEELHRMLKRGKLPISELLREAANLVK
jgi:hypothetical protein